MTAIDEKALGAAIIEGSNMAGERLVTQIVTAYLKALGDEGWVLVPKEPTEAMIADGWLSAHRVDTKDRCNHEMLRRAYSAMLAAAGGREG